MAIAGDIWRFEVDDGQITQVVNNLVINAVQAMSEGVVVTVEMSNVVLADVDPLPLKAGPYVVTTIRDTGAGIPADSLGKIFDPFFTTKPDGNGLGLSTTYSIIQRHDGHIAVESEVGVGTAFTFYLPANAAAARPSLVPPTPMERVKGGRALSWTTKRSCSRSAAR
jgi:two-component system, cell cycle sensor histidine kinase and response regulator CckA